MREIEEAGPSFRRGQKAANPCLWLRNSHIPTSNPKCIIANPSAPACSSRSLVADSFHHPYRRHCQTLPYRSLPSSRLKRRSKEQATAAPYDQMRMSSEDPSSVNTIESKVRILKPSGG